MECQCIARNFDGVVVEPVQKLSDDSFFIVSEPEKQTNDALRQHSKHEPQWHFGKHRQCHNSQPNRVIRMIVQKIHQPLFAPGSSF